jgi:hypothetical protein
MDLGSGNLTYKDAQGGNLGTGAVGAPDTAGVYNFTTFNLPAGVSLGFIPDSLNRPVQFLDSGDVTIAGVLTVSGKESQGKKGGAGGPGGFNGGDGGGDTTSTVLLGAPGAGPGGGNGRASNNYAGGSLLIANQLLTPLIGGSGGGGGSGNVANPGDGGSGGSGSLLLASNGTITLNGTIYAAGGSTSNPGRNYGDGGNASAGSGGAVRLVGSTVTGSGTVNVTGGANINCCVTGGAGFVRIEAFTNTGISVVGASSFLRPTTPSPAIPPNLPSIKIASIGGISAPANGTGGLPTQPDISFGQPQSGTVLLNLTTSGIPINTTFTVRVAALDGKYSNNGEARVFTGTTSASGGSASISVPYGNSVVDVYAAFQPTAQTALRFEKAIGEKIARAEVSARYGGGSEVYFITKSGRRIASSQIAVAP